jgi:glycosyltransferase involved in cell wall biosynthesis
VELIERLRAMTDAPIVVVDDGSGESFRGIFEAVKAAGCTVLTHISNMGKGRALKTGFQYIMEHGWNEGVVCADSDGQHAPKDIVAIGQAIEAREATIVPGSRRFTGKVPQAASETVSQAKYTTRRQGSALAIRRPAFADTRTGCSAGYVKCRGNGSNTK